MRFISFIDSDHHGQGPLTVRLHFSAEVNALEWSGLEIWDASGVALPFEALDADDRRHIKEVLADEVLTKRNEHYSHCAWLRRVGGRI